MDAWRHLAENFQNFTPFPAMRTCAVTVEMWKAALRRKSPRSAPGPDGLSRRDLLAMPDPLIEEILSLLRQAEDQGLWPQQIFTGIISSLAKTPGATKVSHYRPICLLSLCYRTWSSLRCKEALCHVAKYAPPGLLGNLPGAGASDSWYSVLLHIEQAYRQGTAICGVAVDLVKAYNMLPRLPVVAFARMCGIPDAILQPWVSMLTQLRRHFKVRGSTGPPLLSSTGFAEGDPLSCLAMAVLNIACHHNFCSTVEGGKFLSFVDNWHAIAASPGEIIRAHNAVTTFAQAWDLPIDAEKTVVWCATAKGREELRQAGFQVTLDFRELGAHLASSRRGTNFTQTERIRALDDKWPRLEASLSPFAHKVRALSTAAWPAALHGISASPLGERHFIKMRSDAMKALGLRAPGANPMLQLSLAGHSINDPEFYALLSSFKDAKFLAGHEAVAPLLASAVREVRKVPGPCTILLQRANAIGIAWNPVHAAFEDSLGMFDLWTMSWPEVMQRLLLAWQDWVQQRHTCRHTFEGLPDRTCPQETAAASQGAHAPLPERHFFHEQCTASRWLGRSLRLRLLWPAGLNPSPPPCMPLLSSLSCSLAAGDLEALPPAQLLHGWAGKPPSLHTVRMLPCDLPLDLQSFHPFPDLPEYHARCWRNIVPP